MKIIAVMSPKGGIGKTTTSDAIAYMLGEEQEKRVLILDGDPQGDTSKTFEAYEPEGTGMSELLERHVSVGGSYRTTDLIRPTQYSHIDIIPANGYLMQTDMKLLRRHKSLSKQKCFPSAVIRTHIQYHNSMSGTSSLYKDISCLNLGFLYLL